MIRSNRTATWTALVFMAMASVFVLALNAQTLQAQGGGLRIVVISGEDAVNVIQQKTAVAPVIEVRDRNDLPVPGAVVTFSVQGGKAALFASGSPTMTITTNAAGRAAAAALNPLGSGAVQINVQAVFQGQTVAATIAQTNVLTAAEAAQAAAAGAGGGGSGGAGAGGTGGAAGGGGGLSGTTLGIVGAAVGGGALAATKIAGGGDDGATPSGPTTGIYTGSFSGQLVDTFTSTNNSPTCVITRSIVGTMKMTLEQRADGSVTGKAEMTGTDIVVGSSCGSDLGFSASFNRSADVTGTVSSLAFRNQGATSAPAPVGGTQTSQQTVTFAGALNGTVITGTMKLDESMEATNPVVRSSGSVTFPITLNKGS